MHHWTQFNYWWTFALIGFGGLLGVLFSVPLRRTLILEQKLLFPEGVAAAPSGDDASRSATRCRR